MKLYHYIHCPFCLRIRMAAGFLGISYESKVLPYDDEATPIELMGKKMLPIAEVDGNISNESLDIIKMMDKGNLLKSDLFDSEIDQLLSKLGSDVHSMAMPYWIWTPEFDKKSREYFQKKKEVKRGPFKDLVKNKKKFADSLNKNLTNIEKYLTEFYKSPEISILDIALASHLWGMYIVPEFQFSPVVHKYLQRIKELTKFDYHEDYWK